MTSLYHYIHNNPVTITLNQDDAVYIAPNIPHGKLHGALSSFIPAGVSPNDVLVLIDDTVFGSAKEGVALTSTHLYCKQIMDAPKQFALNTIQSIHFGSGFLNGGLYVNGQYVSGMTKPSNHSMKLFAQLVTGFLAELANMQASRSTLADSDSGLGNHHHPQHSSGSQAYAGQAASHDPFATSVQGQNDPFAQPDPFAPSPPRQTDPFSKGLPLIDLLIFFSLFKTGEWNTASVRYIRHCFANMPPDSQTRLEQRMKQCSFNLTVTTEQLARMLPSISMDSRKLLVKWSLQLMLINEFSESEFDHYLHILTTTLALSRHEINWVIDNTEATCAEEWQ